MSDCDAKDIIQRLKENATCTMFQGRKHWVISLSDAVRAVSDQCETPYVSEDVSVR